MKYSILLSVCAIFLTATSGFSADFSEGSKAKAWNLEGEQKALFKAKVVDPLCVLHGDCTDDCGGGKRQLVLLRKADGVLLFALKNSQSAFSGAVTELLPFCNKAVEVDGLVINNPELGVKNIYMVQKIRLEGDADWIKANRWTKEWAKANPEAKGKGPWFRRDPRVKAEIAREGYLGLGLEADEVFIKLKIYYFCFFHSYCNIDRAQTCKFWSLNKTFRKNNVR